MPAEALTERRIVEQESSLPAWNWIDLRERAGQGEPDTLHMASDGELLDSVGKGRQPASIRCYTWHNSCVTFGRLQSESAVTDAYPGLPLYRRPTGGKAVLHGGDLTIAVCATHNYLEGWGRSVNETKKLRATYLKLVAPVRDALAAFGLETRMGADQCQIGDALDDATRNEDCFAYTAMCDVVSAGNEEKLLGSAMRRTSTAVLLQISLRPLAGIDVTGDSFIGELRRQYQTR